MCFSIADAAEWQAGLTIPAWEARRFYILISASVFVATIIDFGPINTVTVLYWSQIVAGFLTIPVLGFILLLGNNSQISGRRNTPFENFWLGGAVGAMMIADIIFVWIEYLH
jgi:Mn2+/Fe2+ NRAMP family transporter